MREDLLTGYRWILEELNAKIDNIADISRVCLTGCSAGGTLIVFMVRLHDAYVKMTGKALDIEAAGLTVPKAIVPVFAVLDWTFDPKGVAADDGKSSASMELLMGQPTETSASLS